SKKKAEIAKSQSRQRKIQRLKELIADPTYPSKADALFRLAETHWKEAKFENFLSMEKYEAAYVCFEEKRCAKEPDFPDTDYSVSIGYYRDVLRADPNYPRLDQVTYYLGRAAVVAGKSKKDRQLEKEGEKHLQDVVQKFPKSSYVPSSHLTLAEYYFDKDSLYYAKTNYEKIIQNFPGHPMFNYAMYKLGWVYFNLAEFEKTVDTFKRVIASVKDKSKDTGLIEFRGQALNDLVQTYAELDNGWQMARDYFLKEVGEEDTYKKLDKMAALLVTKDRDDEAVTLYKHLIQHDRTASAAVEYYDAVMEVRRKIGDLGETEAEINEITAFFDGKGQWRIANKTDQEVMGAADELVSTNLASLANIYHRDAETREKKRKPAKNEYEKAAKYYSEFLDRFPDHPDSYKLNFFYAQILFDEFDNRNMEAAAQYEKVLAKDKKGEFVEDAALGVVFAIEKELVKQGLRETSSKGDVQVIKKPELKQEVSRESENKIERTDLHPLEARMIAASDKYVEVLSDALKDPAFREKYPKRGKLIPNMMFIAAEIFHAHGQFQQAIERMQVIFDTFPKHKMANYAVALIIDAYKRLKRWEEIEYWARELIRKKNYLQLKKPEIEKIIAIAKTEHATDLTRQRKFDEAIRVQSEIVDEFGRKNEEVASKALFNIGAIHEIARRWPQAVSAYEQVIKRYKAKEVAVDALSAIGLIYESQTEFKKAAEAFVGMQQFKTRFKKKPAVAERAALAYRDAGVLYEALEDYDQAHDVYTAYYSKLYKGRDDVKLVAFQSAAVLEYKKTPESSAEAGKIYEKIAKKFGRKDREYKVRANAAAGLAHKGANKVKNRRKVEKLLKGALKDWDRLERAVEKDGITLDPQTKGYAARASFELAEYEYDDYAKLSIDAVNRSGTFDMGVLKRTLLAKAEALKKASDGFNKVLDFKDKGMAAAAAFRLGQTLYEFAESLFDAPAPPGLTPDQLDEYRFALEEFATPLQERALTAFTAALRQAVKDNVYNKWSRLSAIYAAKVNKDEFPLAEFSVQPNHTRDTIQSTSFIKAATRGDTVVDYLRRTQVKKDKTDGTETEETDDTKDEDAKGATEGK
ncbi:MAG: tetratricopeptide (TPR) repeat protein, partial [Myxococcota bacterium]